MSYLVLARKWRPQTFADLVGQEHVAQTLRNAITQDRVAHAFLFTGARGVGKTTIARIMARSLNCLGATALTAEPVPRSARRARRSPLGRDPDVQEIDGASNNGVDDVRRLQETLPYRPLRDRYKVVIIDEVHMLSPGAWNALLKTLEEPPPHVKFIFATTEVHKVSRRSCRGCSATTSGSSRRADPRARGAHPPQEGIALRRRRRGPRRARGRGLAARRALAPRPGDRRASRASSPAPPPRAARRGRPRVLYDLARAMLTGDAATRAAPSTMIAARGLRPAQRRAGLLGVLRDLVVARVASDPVPARPRRRGARAR
jgi:DNA polymerase-3 subunit gamma/tau